MLSQTLDRHLTALDVEVHAFVVCEVDDQRRLKLPPMELPLVHYVLVGSGLLCTDEGVCVPISPHSIVFLPPATGHYLAVNEAASDVVDAGDACSPLGDGLLKFSSGEFEIGGSRLVTACGTLTAKLSNGQGLFERLQEPLVEDCHGSSPVRQAFEQMLRELSEPSFGTRALAEALVKQCLVLVLRAKLSRGEIGLLPLLSFQDQRLTPALMAMLDEPARDHSIESLAALARMGRSLFAERFAQVFGQPPIEFLKQLRMHHGARLLRTTDMSVSLIATAVGYASRSYFSRAFREAYGTDPSQYREQARKNAAQPHTIASRNLVQKLVESVTGPDECNRDETLSE